MLIPLRNLGSSGIITDRDPYSLPPGAWSRGNNVWFSDGVVRRAPVFRTADTVTPTAPSFLYAVQTGSGYDRLIYAHSTGELYQWLSGVETDVTIAGFTPGASTAPHTACMISGVPVVNRPSHIPYYQSASAVDFAALTGWDANHRANAMRSFKDFLMAMNITKTATNYPNMVKWSDAASALGAPPASWDHTDTTKKAGEKQLFQLTSPLMDGMTLGDTFILYSQDEVWQALFVGGIYVFEWRRLFRGGVINQNCVVEAHGMHYVFGPEDIYRHNGVEMESLARGKGVWDGIYPAMRTANLYRCFTVHVPKMHSVFFFFPSDHDDVIWTAATHANRAAVYNYREDNWTFMDVPNTAGAAVANITSGVGSTWADAASEGTAWEDRGGTWASVTSGGYDRHLCVINVPCTGITGSTLYGVETLERGTLLLPIDNTVVPPAYVARDDLNLDELGPLALLPGTKLVRGLYPHMTADDDVTWRVDVRNSFGVNPTAGVETTFAPGSQYRIDMRHTGRLLSYQLSVPEDSAFRLSGMDADVVLLGGR